MPAIRNVMLIRLAVKLMPDARSGRRRLCLHEKPCRRLCCMAAHTLGESSALWNRTALPFNYHAEHRHRIPKLLYRVTNCAEYDALLVSDTAATGLDLS